MTFWSSERIKRWGCDLVDPYQPDHVVHSAYEMEMGPEAFITGGHPESAESLQKIELRKRGDQLVIPPGQFALLLAEEKVTMPDGALGLISMRSSYKMHGLINVSGFHVDPGYHGQLLFAVYNAGGNHVVLERGERVFMIWWASLSNVSEDLYEHKVKDGGREDQKMIKGSDIAQIGPTAFSPAEVSRRVEELEIKVGTWERLTYSLTAAVVGAFVGGIIALAIAVLG